VIEVKAYATTNGVKIEITDNGEGIPFHDLEKLNRGDFRKMSERGGHTTGLGLGNVYDRLNHFFEAEGIMIFESKINEFTRVIISLPRKDDTTC